MFRLFLASVRIGENIQHTFNVTRHRGFKHIADMTNIETRRRPIAHQPQRKYESSQRLAASTTDTWGWQTIGANLHSKYTS